MSAEWNMNFGWFSFFITHFICALILTLCECKLRDPPNGVAEITQFIQIKRTSEKVALHQATVWSYLYTILFLLPIHWIAHQIISACLPYTYTIHVHCIHCAHQMCRTPFCIKWNGIINATFDENTDLWMKESAHKHTQTHENSNNKATSAAKHPLYAMPYIYALAVRGAFFGKWSNAWKYIYTAALDPYDAINARRKIVTHNLR